MEQIIKIYGKFLLDAMALVIVLSICVLGIVPEIGGHFATEQIPYGADFSFLVSESERAHPTILCRIQEMLYKEKEYAVEELLQASDYQGRALEVHIRCISYERANVQEDVTQVIYNKDSGKVCFRKNGIYTFLVSAVDEWNRETITKIRIPVN